jgi:hypothetical protein
MDIQQIRNQIHDIRGYKVMLDFDLASLYDVETRVLNQSVKRNIDNFPPDFMFRLTVKEWEQLSSGITLTVLEPDPNSSQFVMSSKKHRGKSYTPYAFTEHGVAMLASVLKSPKARKMNVAIVRAFIELRKFSMKYAGLKEQLHELRTRIGEHDLQLLKIYASIESLLDQKQEEQEKWDNRERIGFVT